PAAIDRSGTEPCRFEHAADFRQGIRLAAHPKDVDGPGSRVANKISPGIGFVACIIKIFRQYQLREAPCNEIVPYPPFLLTVQSGKEPWSIHIEHKHATRTQAPADAPQHFFGIMTGHLSKASEDERHGVKYRLVLHSADVSLHKLDGQASLMGFPLGCSNSCWSEIKARYQRAASSHRQAVTPAPAGNIEDALTRA